MSRISNCVAFILASVLALSPVGFAKAQGYPNRVVTLVVPANAGSAPDVVARILGPALSKYLGQQVIIDNKSGADQMVGFEHVAKRVPPDGYTIIAGSAVNLAIAPSIKKNLPFDPLSDLLTVTTLTKSRVALVTGPGHPWKTFEELMVYAKANPGKLNYASNAPNTRLFTEAVIRARGVNVVYVPYRETAGMLSAILVGDAHMGLGVVSTMAMGGKLRVLAVSGEPRAPDRPDVPTFAELGFPKILSQIYTLHVPKGTPTSVIETLYSAASRALNDPDTVKRLAQLQIEPMGERPEVATRFLLDSAKFLEEVAHQAGIKPE